RAPRAESWAIFKRSGAGAGTRFPGRATSRPSCMAPNFQADLDGISRSASVPLILDVICRVTGLRFAAVARVTQERWICLASKDLINLGVAPGGELDVQTTLCHEVRQS